LLACFLSVFLVLQSKGYEAKEEAVKIDFHASRMLMTQKGRPSDGTINW
jgi:hypothetical protein